MRSGAVSQPCAMRSAAGRSPTTPAPHWETLRQWRDCCCWADMRRTGSLRSLPACGCSRCRPASRPGRRTGSTMPTRASLRISVSAARNGSALAASVAARPSHGVDDADESVIADVGPDRRERLAETGARLQAAEQDRIGPDREWSAAFLAVLFAIHVSRMGFDRSALGIFSPLVAVAGDIVVALALTYFVIVPVRLFVRRTTRVVERTAWERVLDGSERTGVANWPRRALRWWLESRMRFAIRLRSARYSLASAFGRGLQIGLPLTAVIVASVPIWGMSWYFDTENWAAGIWNSWAASRTDTWRAAMVRDEVASWLSTLDGRGFMIKPDNFTGSEPFSFVVIGDTGEGDASQLVLKDSLLRASGADDVRFVVVSSDVVYPTGAMKDYESH